MSTVRETGRRLGFITPLTHNFCESCNRVRLTCTGTLYMCLGQEDAADLRTPLRQSEGDEARRGGDPRSDRAQAEGPRFHHRPPPQPARGVAAHERHRRVTRARSIRGQSPCVAFVASETEAAQLALARAAPALRPGAPEEADVIVPLGGDGFMLETLHRFVGTRHAGLRHEPRQRRVPDERVPARTACTNASPRRRRSNSIRSK